jgi:hypothetical protein
VNDGYDSYRLEHFHEGQRIELHPATDFWVAGARYGTVVSVGTKKVNVSLDKLTGIHHISPGMLRPVED